MSPQLPSTPPPWDLLRSGLGTYRGPIHFPAVSETNYRGQRLYNLSLQSIVNNAPLQTVQFAGWRFLARDPRTHKAVAVYVNPNSHPPTPAITSISTGPGVEEALAAAVRIAGPVPLDGGPTYEVVMIPGLSTEAMWVKPPGDATEWFVPYHTKVGGLEGDQIFSFETFIKALSSMAATVLDFERQDLQRPKY